MQGWSNVPCSLCWALRSVNDYCTLKYDVLGLYRGTETKGTCCKYVDVKCFCFEILLHCSCIGHVSDVLAQLTSKLNWNFSSFQPSNSHSESCSVKTKFCSDLHVFFHNLILKECWSGCSQRTNLKALLLLSGNWYFSVLLTRLQLKTRIKVVEFEHFSQRGTLCKSTEMHSSHILCMDSL